MYKIYVDGLPLYDPLLEEYSILSGKVDLEVNKAGSLTFSIPKENPHYGLAKLMKSIVTLYDDDRLIFKGRPYAPSRNLFRDNEIICEGSLAFFNDSIQEPFEYFGTVEGLFTQVINNHNSQVDEDKRFKLGVINVVNSTEEGNITRSDSDYKSTWDILREKFFESALNGYLWIRYEEDGMYIDYRDDLNFICNQDVEQSINLMDVKESVSCSELATAVIPLGAKVEDVYTTIEDVNNGVKYLYDEEAVAEYGWIFKVVKHDDINDKSILLRTGQQDLAEAVGVTTTIEVKASDLSKAGYNVNPFSFGTYVNVVINNLNIDRKMLIKKLSFDLLKPESSEITVGDEIKSFTNNFETIVGNINSSIVTDYNSKIDGVNNSIIELTKEVTAQISASTAGIVSEVSEKFYTKDETDTLVNEISTQLTQTKESFDFTFTTYQTDLEGLRDGTNAEFEEIKKMIRFVDGKIKLGIEGDELELTLQNDRLYFSQNGKEVAYFSNSKLYITDAEILASLRIGKFAFIPRANGSLDFKKVG